MAVILPNAAPAQSASRALTQFTAKLFWFISIIRRHAYKKPNDLQSIPNHPGFRFEADFFPASSFNLKHSFSRHILLIFIRA
ncbi:hypothetical protein PSR59_01595 [Ligilactobacillus ruminis]|uniref:Uncharacterized protein n=1 Tax=Ligilactobacillus ruminis TaxID=1623 RepID=A0AAQ3ATE9_9LACO|nr:hypothetical protein [Ligilactobacillus ruminis]WDC82360.1 hypothetical protein PSR59_01595 [Ligilactobacillus ruminis]